MSIYIYIYIYRFPSVKCAVRRLHAAESCARMHVTHAFLAKLHARSRVVRDILGHRSPAAGMPMSVEAECEIREIVAQSRGGDFLVRNVQ